MWLPRYLQASIRADLAEKMVFIAGPRQVGKTTLVRQILALEKSSKYYSWENRGDRREILNAKWPAEPSWIGLDELHKYRFWKRWLKGEFDKHRDRLRFLITGSSRLDLYRKGGDSLQGRYHHYRLHPLSLGEIENESKGSIKPGEPLPMPTKTSSENMKSLFQFGGFPEPFLAQSERTLRRWQKERLDRFFREDVRDLETIRDLSTMELLADMMVRKVGLPLSLNSLREDLEVSHKAIDHWVGVLERLYHVFLIRPFHTRFIRGLRKMPKAFLWDFSTVSNAGARFENLVACHLLKFCHWLEDSEGYRLDLHYLRDKDGREVDFLVAWERKPWFAVEAKLSVEPVSKSLLYFKSRLNIPYAFQISLEEGNDLICDEVRCLPASKFLLALV